MLNNIKVPVQKTNLSELLSSYDLLIKKLSKLNLLSDSSEIDNAFLYLNQELPTIFFTEKQIIKASSNENAEIYLQEHEYFLTKKLQIQHQINTNAPQQLILFSIMRLVDKIKQHSQNIHSLFQA